MLKIGVPKIIVVSLLLMVGCNTRYQLDRIHDRQGIVNVRQPLRSEKKEQADSTDIPKEIKYQDKDGKEINILSGEKDGDDYLYSVQLQGVEVVAKSKTLPERNGMVTISFIVMVPEEYLQSGWRIKVEPSLDNNGDVKALQPVVVTGSEFKYISDRKRFYQDKNMKSDIALERRLLERRNKRSVYRYKDNKEVDSLKNILSNWQEWRDGFYAHDWRLDSVIQKKENFEYYYNQDFPSEDMEKKLKLSFVATVEDLDGQSYPLPAGDTLNYFISSMMQFLDRTPRYVRHTIYRKATENASCLVNFPVGSTEVIDTLGSNKEELGRVASKMREINEGNEFVIDSIILKAGCSPEGGYAANKLLAAGRAVSLHSYLAPVLGTNAEAVELVKEQPQAENWEKLTALIKEKELPNKDGVLEVIQNTEDPDQREFKIREEYPEDYEVIRNELYPMLRAVDFVFYLSRRGMVEDVVYTNVIDTAYANALKLMDRRKYKEAMPKLLEYQDWNTAICYMSLGYNDTAIKIFEKQKQSADRDYMLAILYSRVGKIEKAVETFMSCCKEDESKIDRGELDPEISRLMDKYNLRDRLY